MMKVFKGHVHKPIGLKVRQTLPDVYEFHCHACNETHYFIADGKVMWNEQLLKPTVWPQLRYDYKFGQGECILFINRGNLIYSNDCTHEMKGQTIEMKILC